ncbi:MAG: flagellar biosynthetic protein FliR [Bacteroidetes bacterium]|nr:flagellar biosynthetic protein FliR [Bacteroidota bacterium]MCL5027295.1 flagellar biosynthetic protein FliR [Chloroflexota bacterium]
MALSSGLLGLTPSYLVVLFLMVVRMGALLLTTPILGARTVPAMTKIGLAIVLSFVLLPSTAGSAVLPPTFGHLLVAIGKETAIGLLAGFAVTLLFSSLQIVATLAGVQLGFGFSSTVDVTYTGQSPVLDHLFTGMATLIFLSGNFHHQFLIGVQRLFEMMPPNAFSFYRISPEGLVLLSANMFLVAVRIVLPLLGALLLTEIAMAVMARTAPQMNVFFVGMPVKIGIGIFAIMVMLPFVINRIEALFGDTATAMALILRYQ